MKDTNVHEIVAAFVIGVTLTFAFFQITHPADKVDEDVKVCVTYEQSSGKCAVETTVGKIVDDYIAEANK